MPTPRKEEANDNDHETSDQVTTKPRRSTRTHTAPEWYGNPVLEVMLLENSSSKKSVPVIPIPISEEANDDD